MTLSALSAGRSQKTAAGFGTDVRKLLAYIFYLHAMITIFNASDREFKGLSNELLSVTVAPCVIYLLNFIWTPMSVCWIKPTSQAPKLASARIFDIFFARYTAYFAPSRRKFFAGLICQIKSYTFPSLNLL